MTGFQSLQNMPEFDVRYSKVKTEDGNAPAMHDKTTTQVASDCYGGKHNCKRRADDTLNEDESLTMMIKSHDSVAVLFFGHNIVIMSFYPINKQTCKE
jgi:hypothetical protein